MFSEYGLYTLYNVNRQVTKVINLYLTWPFLPKFEMAKGLRYIRRLVGNVKDTTARRSLRRFHANYMRKFWLQKITPSRLSVFGLAKRTTNDLENLHRRMKSAMPKNPIFLRFLHHLMTNIFQPSNQLLIHLNNHDQLPPAPKPKQQERNE
jgi:hypothetical protein